jgi:hypothetical protein
LNLGTNIHRGVLELLCTSLFALAAFWQLNECLWNDEIYTLKNFVLPGWIATLTDYHVPNNHILANILHIIWLRALAISDLGTLLDAPWKIRMLPMLLSGATVLVTYRVAQRTWGHVAGWVAVVCLLTTLAFVNFGWQVRGYPLSLLAAVGLAGAALRVTTQRRCDLRTGCWLVAMTVVLMYAIPSNLYFVVSTGVGLVVAMGRPLFRTGLVAGACILGGILLSALLYMPVWAQVTDNEYITGGRAFRFLHFANLKEVVSQFVGWRWVLLPIIGWGFWLARTDVVAKRQLMLLAGIFLGSFLCSALRGDEPPLRIYVVQLSPLVLLAALGWHHAYLFFVEINWHRHLPWLSIAICVASLLLTQQNASQRIKSSLAQKEILQDINHNYYQYWFDPNTEFDLFKEKTGTSATIVLEGTEPHDLPNYLEHKGLRYVSADSIQLMMEREDTVYVCSKFTGDFIRTIQQMPDWTYTFLQEKERYPRIVICTRK